MVHLTQLPPEILHNILSHVEPEDTGYIRQTCRYLLTFIDGNRALFRELYYRTLDEPPTTDLDWEKEIRDYVRLRHICLSHGGLDKNKVDPVNHHYNHTRAASSELPFVHDVTTRLLSRSARSGPSRPARSVTHAPSRNAALLAEFFADEGNRTAFLSRSFIFERARGERKDFSDPPRPEHQMSAHLHCLYGMPLLKHGRTRSSRMYPFACSKVYDLREYTEHTHWGPFMGDGSLRVDWEKVEAILLVLRSNIKNKSLDSFSIFSHFWDKPFAGPWEGSYIPWPPAAEREEEQSELERRDPYDVSGTWLRVVCFLDYNDFFSYNFPIGDEIPDNVPRPALDTFEATRLILMKIHVTDITDPEEGDGDGPVVHFKGFSRSLDSSWDDNADSDLRGRIRCYGEVFFLGFSLFWFVQE
ncbi:hypothetical protein GE09DRAFT_1099789 [Coniochaeta sp. 2T2.1]|nr:hypothetical protein GE09DRAFT_1099789 [Coniochaeta sp. 2T2.1]